MTFGSWLYARRKELNLTQKDVAKRAGISVSYVSTLERQQPHTITGALIQPDRDVVANLARALGANVDDALLLCGYAPVHEPDVEDVLDGVTILFDRAADLTAADREKIMETVRLIAAGIKAQKAQERLNDERRHVSDKEQ